MSTSVSAVRTTGIYCRDGCPAKPLPSNVTPFRSAPAAEAAGYRPCLRCRPDRLPPVAGDRMDIAGRALTLIAEGALDHGSEEALARRLGLTARHLRRLFQSSVGATPVFVARSRRAHFARRLLDETDLQISAIAFAAGFSSVRQMNRVIATVFRFTPQELRAKRRDADRLTADGGLPLRAAYAGALDFHSLLAHRRPRAIPGVESVAGGVYRRTVSTCGHPGAIEVSDPGDGRHLRIVAHLPTLRALIDEVQRCRRQFGLDRPGAVATALSRDPLLGPLIDRRPGLRVPGAWDPFETSTRILLGQQVSVAAATTLAGRLVDAFGSPVPGLGTMGLTHVFPSAARIAEASIDRIRAIGLPAARARALRAFARAYDDEAVRLDAGIRLDQLTDTLQSVPGIGPWTAEMIALFAAGQPDAFPAGDLGLRRRVARLTGGTGVVDARDLALRAEAWRPHRALAAMHLWMSAWQQEDEGQ